MVYLITGASHVGKTLIAQKLMEKLNIPYLSIDHLKMGLIRSGNTNLTPMNSIESLTNYLWPIVTEIIKTNIENNQSIIIEGCYIPFDYRSSFDDDYLSEIRYKSIIFSNEYCLDNYNNINLFASIIENRSEEISLDNVLRENKYYLEGCIEHKNDYILVKDKYNINDFINIIKG